MRPQDLAPLDEGVPIYSPQLTHSADEMNGETRMRFWWLVNGLLGALAASGGLWLFWRVSRWISGWIGG